ncbi:MAG: sigma-54-dependent Fis family transcriptional regulator [Deltaproteobacteria bacterium]|nr:sigma-54-dependent Fis family transcriptional regulator [Deltaproteobacteria bacterium]
MKQTILVVDDERSIRIGLKGLLTKEGYEVTIVENGNEALRELARQAYNLVLSDLRMAGLDELSLLKKIKEQHPETSVILMTAYGSEKIAVEAMKAGARDYLIKPFDNDEVKILVHQAFEQQALQRQVQHCMSDSTPHFVSKISLVRARQCSGYSMSSREWPQRT